MASYRLLIKPSAVRELEGIPSSTPTRVPRWGPGPDRTRLVSRVQRLAADPRPAGSEKLSGQEKYRLRQGDYRILYLIDDAQASVVVVKIGHRREVYR